MNDLFEDYNRRNYGDKPQNATQAVEAVISTDTQGIPVCPPTPHKYGAESLESEKATEDMLLAQAEDHLKAEFEIWKQTPGANHVLEDLYKITSRYATRFKKTGRRVSMKLIYELERDQIRYVKERMRRRGMELKNWKNFALNNNFHSIIARHIIAHRPQWKGIFEFRERTSKV